jgi:hypothetical protein
MRAVNQGFGPFDRVGKDPLNFGIGLSFQARRVTEILGLKKSLS